MMCLSERGEEMAIEPLKLTKEQQKVLEDLGTDVADLEREIARMERAGIDTKDLRERFEKARKLREGVLREYGA